MYIPQQFKNENLEEVKSFLKENSFGILLTRGDKKMQGTHIPLELEKDPQGLEVLYGHVAKGNPQWKGFNTNKEVLLIFNGPQAYVSSSWYDHENVSTWNYIAVHIYGRIEILNNEELSFSLNKLVDKYESRMETPFRMSDMSERTLNQMKGIVGFKVYIEEIQAAYKLSQNRNDHDYKNVIEKLEEQEGSQGNWVAEKMKDQRTI